MDFSKYNKTIVAIIGAVMTWLLANYTGDADVSKWLSLAAAVLTAAGVYQVPNTPLKEK